MVLRIKELVRAIRACKTAADERAVISKESALIRTSFKEDTSLEARTTNIAKLLYIHMLGYPAHFGQIECLKLVAAGKFAEKRLGYLGIMLLLDENQEVLTLVTNSLKNDMNHSNMYIVGLSLCTMGNIASAEMSRDLSPEVEKLMGSGNGYIKKKAALCAIRIVRKVPDLADQYIPLAKSFLTDRHHAVIMTGMTLATVLCQISDAAKTQFRAHVPQITRTLKSLLVPGYIVEHDVNGINDPFLQVKCLRLLRVLGKDDAAASEAMNDTLAQIATNTDGTRTVGNAILYESCLTIIEIKADVGLRVLAINILGRFLANRDNNIRYVALNTLSKTVSFEMNAVQRHRNIVLECLRDPDISIRRRALELGFVLINEANVRVMVREFLVFLETADTEFKHAVPTRICAMADRFAPNKRWHIDTIIRVLKLAGNYVKEEVLANFIKLVGSVPELQSYAVYKLFYALKKNFSQEYLALAGIWCLGEFGEMLLQGASGLRNMPVDEEEINVTVVVAGSSVLVPEELLMDVNENDAVDLISNILNSVYATPVINEYAITALLKLTSRFKSPATFDRLKSLISHYTTDIDAELQQRSVEYMCLLTSSSLEPIRSTVLAHMPIPAPNLGQNDRKDISSPSKPAHSTLAGTGLLSTSATASPTTSNLLDDLLSIDSTNVHSNVTSVNPNNRGNVADLLSDVFSSTSLSHASSPSATAATNSLASKQSMAVNDIMSLFGAPSPSATTTAAPSFPAHHGTMEATKVFEKQNVVITFNATREASLDPTSASWLFQVLFSVNDANTVTNLSFLVACPKTLRLSLQPVSSTTFTRAQPATQIFRLVNPAVNTMEGKLVGMKLRLKVGFEIGGSRVDEMVEFGGFKNFEW